ncbi:hypothetical protein ABT084_37400 [Streptomyces sp. NPDC002138]|uniref:hypothetical protein n=1 Tax=Streptomyces sp. NPDC002138 TaxID=3154410 RepID=UPI003320E194
MSARDRLRRRPRLRRDELTGEFTTPAGEFTGEFTDRQTAVMSTSRRALGVGPRPESKAVLAIPAPRLLPAERADSVQTETDEPQVGSGEQRRRMLGSGPGTTSTRT